MTMKLYAQATILTYRLFLMLNYSIGDEPPTPTGGTGGFGGYNIFGRDYFEGKSMTSVILRTTNMALKMMVLIGVLFFAWKFASAGIEYFSADEYAISARSNKRTLFFELLEPVKGLALLILLGIILSFVFDKFIVAFESSTSFQLDDPSSIVTTPSKP